MLDGTFKVKSRSNITVRYQNLRTILIFISFKLNSTISTNKTCTLFTFSVSKDSIVLLSRLHCFYCLLSTSTPTPISAQYKASEVCLCLPVFTWRRAKQIQRKCFKTIISEYQENLGKFRSVFIIVFNYFFRDIASIIQQSV